MAVFMPIKRPAESRRAPPELPGLMAASVWMTFVMGRPDGEVTWRALERGGVGCGGEGGWLGGLLADAG